MQNPSEWPTRPIYFRLALALVAVARRCKLVVGDLVSRTRIRWPQKVYQQVHSFRGRLACPRKAFGPSPLSEKLSNLRKALCISTSVQEVLFANQMFMLMIIIPVHANTYPKHQTLSIFYPSRCTMLSRIKTCSAESSEYSSIHQVLFWTRAFN